MPIKLSKTDEIMSKLESGCLDNKPECIKAIVKMNECLKKDVREIKYRSYNSERSSQEAYLTA